MSQISEEIDSADENSVIEDKKTLKSLDSFLSGESSDAKHSHVKSSVRGKEKASPMTVDEFEKFSAKTGDEESKFSPRTTDIDVNSPRSLDEDKKSSKDDEITSEEDELQTIIDSTRSRILSSVEKDSELILKARRRMEEVNSFLSATPSFEKAKKTRAEPEVPPQKLSQSPVLSSQDSNLTNQKDISRTSLLLDQYLKKYSPVTEKTKKSTDDNSLNTKLKEIFDREEKKYVTPEKKAEKSSKTRKNLPNKQHVPSPPSSIRSSTYSDEISTSRKDDYEESALSERFDKYFQESLLQDNNTIESSTTGGKRRHINEFSPESLSTISASMNNDDEISVSTAQRREKPKTNYDSSRIKQKTRRITLSDEENENFAPEVESFDREEHSLNKFKEEINTKLNSHSRSSSIGVVQRQKQQKPRNHHRNYEENEENYSETSGFPKPPTDYSISEDQSRVSGAESIETKEFLAKIQQKTRLKQKKEEDDEDIPKKKPKKPISHIESAAQKIHKEKELEKAKKKVIETQKQLIREEKEKKLASKVAKKPANEPEKQQEQLYIKKVENWSGWKSFKRKSPTNSSSSVEKKQNKEEKQKKQQIEQSARYKSGKIPVSAPKTKEIEEKKKKIFKKPAKDEEEEEIEEIEQKKKKYSKKPTKDEDYEEIEENEQKKKRHSKKPLKDEDEDEEIEEIEEENSESEAESAKFSQIYGPTSEISQNEPEIHKKPSKSVTKRPQIAQKSSKTTSTSTENDKNSEAVATIHTIPVPESSEDYKIDQCTQTGAQTARNLAADAQQQQNSQKIAYFSTPNLNHIGYVPQYLPFNNPMINSSTISNSTSSNSTNGPPSLNNNNYGAQRTFNPSNLRPNFPQFSVINSTPSQNINSSSNQMNFIPNSVNYNSNIPMPANPLVSPATITRPKPKSLDILENSSQLSFKNDYSEQNNNNQNNLFNSTIKKVENPIHNNNSAIQKPKLSTPFHQINVVNAPISVSSASNSAPIRRFGEMKQQQTQNNPNLVPQEVPKMQFFVPQSQKDENSAFFDNISVSVPTNFANESEEVLNLLNLNEKDLLSEEIAAAKRQILEQDLSDQQSSSNFSVSAFEKKIEIAVQEKIQKELQKIQLQNELIAKLQKEKSKNDEKKKSSFVSSSEFEIEDENEQNLDKSEAFSESTTISETTSTISHQNKNKNKNKKINKKQKEEEEEEDDDDDSEEDKRPKPKHVHRALKPLQELLKKLETSANLNENSKISIQQQS